MAVWCSLPAIYEEYCTRLIKLGIGYPGLLYRITAERIRNGEDIGLEPKRYIIAGFNALSTSEQVLFDHIAKSEHGAEFYWDYDNYYVENSDHEAGLFMRPLQIYWLIILKVAQLSGFTCPPGDSEASQSFSITV